MGYARYVADDGREAGYSVDAVCDVEACDAVIDRGQYYKCDNPDCSMFCCGEHLIHVRRHEVSVNGAFLCPECLELRGEDDSD